MKNHIFLLATVGMVFLKLAIMGPATAATENHEPVKLNSKIDMNMSLQRYIELAQSEELSFAHMSAIHKKKGYLLPFAFIPQYVHRAYPISQIKQMIDFNVLLQDVVDLFDLGDSKVSDTLLSIDHVKNHLGIVNLYTKRGKNAGSMKMILAAFNHKYLPENNLTLCQIAILYNINKEVLAELIAQESVEKLELHFPAAFRIYYDSRLERRVKSTDRYLGKSIEGHTPMTFAHKFKLDYLIDLLIQKGVSLDVQTKSGKLPTDYYKYENTEVNVSHEIIDLRDFPPL